MCVCVWCHPVYDALSCNLLNNSCDVLCGNNRRGRRNEEWKSKSLLVKKKNQDVSSFTHPGVSNWHADVILLAVAMTTVFPSTLCFSVSCDLLDPTWYMMEFVFVQTQKTSASTSATGRVADGKWCFRWFNLLQKIPQSNTHTHTHSNTHTHALKHTHTHTHTHTPAVEASE